MQTKVSIIVPVYNAEKSIEKCLNSILQQTYPHMEIVIVNDGSTDTTHQICASVYRQYPDKVKLVDQKNSGPAAARNHGIDRASGAYIAFVDADDYISPDMIEKMVNAADENAAEMVVCGYYLETGSSVTESTYFWGDGLYSGQTSRNIALECTDDSSKKSLPPYSPVRMVRKAVLDDNGLRYQVGLIRSEDYHFWTKVHYCVDRLYILGNEHLYHYVENANSITHRHVKGYWNDVKFIYKDLLQYLPEEAYVRDRLSTMLIRRSLIALNNAARCSNIRQAHGELRGVLSDALLRGVLQSLSGTQLKRFGMYGPLMRHHGSPVVYIRYMFRNLVYKLRA